MSSYKDKESIYIAFRIRSKNCEALILDNIGLYGGAVGAVGTVESIYTNNYDVIIGENDVSIIGAEVEEISIYDMNGRNMATAKANKISTEDLDAGIYIVRATTANESIVHKIVVK